MTSLVDARDDLEDAVTAAGVRCTQDLGGVEPPGVMLRGDGIDVAHIVRGQVTAVLRLTLLAGAWDSRSAAHELAGLQATVLGVLRELTAYGVGEMSPDVRVRIAGGDYLGSFITVSRMCDV